MVRRTVANFANSFWDLVCSLMINLFGFIARYIFRFQGEDDDSRKFDVYYDVVQSQIDDQNVADSSEDLVPEKELAISTFPFRCEESKWLCSTSKFQYMSIEDIRGFVAEQETMSFTIQEKFMGSSDQGLIRSPRIEEEMVETFGEEPNVSSTGNDQSVGTQVAADEHGERTEDSVKSLCSERDTMKEESEIVEGHQLCQNEEMGCSENEFSDGFYNLSSEVQVSQENRSLPVDDSEPKNEGSDSDIIGGNDQSAGTEVSAGEYGDGTDSVKCLSSERDTGKEERHDVERQQLYQNQEMGSSENASSDGFYNLYCEVQFPREDRSLPGDDSELENEGSNSDITRTVVDTTIEFIEKITCFGDSADAMKEEEDNEYTQLKHCEEITSELAAGNLGKAAESQETKPILGAGKPKDQTLEGKLWDSELQDDDDDDESDTLWDQRKLVEQLKMEMRNSRTGGLPTILEESETPKMTEDLKPLKINEKIGHMDRMEEIRKFYKSYAEKMKKLDVLNFQTMQAINFMQRKDAVQGTSGQKASVSAMKSLILLHLWPSKVRRIYADPTSKSMNEMHRDLELVYVGQLCLSWEILSWQHRKAKELQDHDFHGSTYNQVAGEFQQFQVLVQRFVEEEPYQGPRLQNYAKNRCLVRSSFLQVPIIKDDCWKNKKGSRNEGEDAISISMLTDIIGEAMQVFWEFLRADKLQVNAILKSPRAIHIDQQDPQSLHLLMDIKATLQKKEKRLKDRLRSGNCIVKKLQKHQGVRLNHELFLAQVELRLLSRVVFLSRLTADQLEWCSKKLSYINIDNTKVSVEPSFLLFPY